MLANISQLESLQNAYGHSVPVLETAAFYTGDKMSRAKACVTAMQEEFGELRPKNSASPQRLEKIKLPNDKRLHVPRGWSLRDVELLSGILYDIEHRGETELHTDSDFTKWLLKQGFRATPSEYSDRKVWVRK